MTIKWGKKQKGLPSVRLIPDDALAVCVIWQEARGESYAGKVGVAEVIRNRMERKYMSDGTVVGTVLHKRQFSGMNDGDPNRIPSFKLEDTSPGVEDCKKAWEEAKQGSNTVKGALHYLNVKVTRALRGGTLPLWAADPHDTSQVNDALVVAIIGQHTFLKGQV